MTKRNRQRVLVVVRVAALVTTVGLFAAVLNYVKGLPHGPIAFTVGLSGIAFAVLSVLQAIALIGDAWDWLTKWAEEGK